MRRGAHRRILAGARRSSAPEEQMRCCVGAASSAPAPKRRLAVAVAAIRAVAARLHVLELEAAIDEMSRDPDQGSPIHGSKLYIRT